MDHPPSPDTLRDVNEIKPLIPRTERHRVGKEAKEI
jgi:hypothetical protein